MNSLTLYQLRTWDGGGGTSATPYCFTDPEVADQVKGPNDHISKLEFIVCDSAEEMNEARIFKDKLHALSKLSEKDRELLGIPIDNDEALLFLNK